MQDLQRGFGLVVTADPWAIAVSGSAQASLTAQYNTGSQFNLTSAATWTSANTSIMTVSAGVVTAHAAGSTTVNAYDFGETPDYTDVK